MSLKTEQGRGMSKFIPLFPGRDDPEDGIAPSDAPNSSSKPSLEVMFWHSFHAMDPRSYMPTNDPQLLLERS